MNAVSPVVRSFPKKTWTLAKSISGEPANPERGLTVVPEPIDMEKAPFSLMHDAARAPTYSLTCLLRDSSSAKMRYVLPSGVLLLSDARTEQRQGRGRPSRGEGVPGSLDDEVKEKASTNAGRMMARKTSRMVWFAKPDEVRRVEGSRFDRF